MNTTERPGGFTLIELLVVIAIISVLAGLGLTVFMGARRDAEEMSAEAFIKSVETMLTQYRNQRDIGTYPPTHLAHIPNIGKITNKTNQGIEALCICLNQSRYKGEHLYDTFDNYENLDEDFTQKKMTAINNNALFEMIDPWGNPYAYFNAVDYADVNVRQYAASTDPNDEPEIITVKPWINPKTKSPYNQNSYQLFSAGPDMQFNTEDDIGNWSSR